MHCNILFRAVGNAEGLRLCILLLDLYGIQIWLKNFSKNYVTNDFFFL